MNHNLLSDTIFFGFSSKMIYHSCELWGVLCQYITRETEQNQEHYCLPCGKRCVCTP